MTRFSISYKINSSPDVVVKRRNLLGGFRLICNDAVLTQSTSKDDTGYFGYWLWPDMMEIIRSIDDLINCGKSVISVYDSEDILFKIVNDQVYIAIVKEDADEEDTEYLKSLYPVGSAGCYVPVKTYFNEVLRVGMEFIGELNAKYKNYEKYEIELFEHNLRLMEKLVEEYTKTH
jgi:hypothetical protein